MRNFKVLAVALALTVSVGCKKKKTEGGGGMASGSTMAGSNDMGSGSGGTMAGSGSGGSMAGSDTGSGSGGSMAGSGAGSAEPPKKEMVNMAPADLKWAPLDPSNADKSPQVAPLWGDMQNGPNGFFIKVKGGSPGTAHTHTNDYHGVTVMGAPDHLQDGQKKANPLPAPTSYWFEPGGAPHNSQCLGKEDCVALVHFNEGKFDFAPAELKKDGKPSDKYKELRAKDLKWNPLDPKQPKGVSVASVWGDGQSGPNGFYIKVPAGGASPPHTHSSDYHGVVVQGVVTNYAPDDKAPKEMPVGSYWFQPAAMPHITACKAGKDCISYIYMTGKFDVQMADGGGGAGSAAGSGGGDMKGGDMKGGDMKGGDMKGSDAKKDEKKKDDKKSK